VALHVAHTNADIAPDGVNEALADLFGLNGRRPVMPDGLGRVGTLPEPMSVRHLAERGCQGLPPTRWGVRAGGDPGREMTGLARVGGSGADALQFADSAGAQAILTSDIKHHYAIDVVASGGPSIIEA